jgi:hypothetical protein
MVGRFWLLLRGGNDAEALLSGGTEPCVRCDISVELFVETACNAEDAPAVALGDDVFPLVA